MIQNLEIEYKNMLSEADYNRVLKSMNFDAGQLQRNEYYDTKNQELFKKGIMCRIRSVDSSYLFTVKIPQSDGVLEHEMYLSTNSVQSDAVQVFFHQFNIHVKDLVCVAFSNTLRHTYEDQYGAWCLDASTFANHQDYELEYELSEPNEKALPHFQAMLTRLQIPPHPSLPKYIRALNSGR